MDSAGKIIWYFTFIYDNSAAISVCSTLDGLCDTYNKSSKRTEMTTVAKLIGFVREKSLRKFIFNWKAFLEDFFQKMEKYQIIIYGYDNY